MHYQVPVFENTSDFINLNLGKDSECFSVTKARPNLAWNICLYTSTYHKDAACTANITVFLLLILEETKFIYLISPFYAPSIHNRPCRINFICI